MINHLLSLLPRLKQYSKSLDDVAVFADIPWAFVDGDGDKVTYIFRRNNELLVSKRGDVATGRWEYLSVMQSMLIEYNGKKSMYNQGFVDNVVMALLKDGTEELFLLANLQKLPDLNVVGYLEGRVRGPKPIPPGSKKVLVKIKLQDSEEVIVFEKESPELPIYRAGIPVYFEKTLLPLPNGVYFTENNIKITVEKGQVINVNKIFEVQLKNSNEFIVLEDDTIEYNFYRVGNFVKLKFSSEPIKNGIYVTEDGMKIVVKGGRVIKITDSQNTIIIGFIIILLVVLFLIALNGF